MTGSPYWFAPRSGFAGTVLIVDPAGGISGQRTFAAARAGEKRGVERVIVEGGPAKPNVIYYWVRIDPPVRIGP